MAGCRRGRFGGVRGRWFAVVASAFAMASCSGGGTTPSDTFQISCPVNREVTTLDGAPVTVDYAAPTTSGGTGTTTTTCSPASGTKFALGATAVVCSATQGQRETVQCSFQVTVVRPPQLSVTKFMAFGDSITQGVVATCPSSITALSAGDVFRLTPRELSITVGPGFSYPTQLKNLLAARYSLQTFEVGNEGRGNDPATDFAGSTNDSVLGRMTLAINTDRPQVVLLLLGANDVNNSILAQPIANGLRAFVRQIKTLGAQPLIATLLPMGGSCRGQKITTIPLVNTAIRTMAGEENVPVVDLYAGFNGVAAPYIGPDGLHPNEAGYQKMAEIFFASIRDRFEVKF